MAYHDVSAEAADAATIALVIGLVLYAVTVWILVWVVRHHPEPPADDH